MTKFINKNKKSRMIIFDIPLFIENKLNKKKDVIIFVNSKTSKVLERLKDKGNTLIIIEHNLDVIKTADWIIDLGPEGGNGGGQVIASGAPEDIIKIKKSHTGKYLKSKL